MTTNTDPVRALIGQWRDAAEFFKGDAGSDIRETLMACASELEAAIAQQPAAVDEAVVERIAALLHEEATGEPWTVAGVEHPGANRDYYRGLARKVAAVAQQPEARGVVDEARSVSSIMDGAVSFVEALAAQLQGGAE
jgi:hypothetical protein